MKTIAAGLMVSFFFLYVSAHAGQQKWIVCGEELPVTEKPAVKSKQLRTLRIGTPVVIDDNAKTKAGYTPVLLPDGKKGYINENGITDVCTDCDLDNDGGKEKLMIGFNKYQLGAKNAKAILVKNGKILSSFDFDTVIDGLNNSDFSLKTYRISVSVVKPAGFTPQATLIEVVYKINPLVDLDGPWGSVYLTWGKDGFSDAFSSASSSNPMQSLVRKMTFPADKGGKKNKVIVTETYDSGEDDPTLQAEQNYQKIISYKWNGKEFIPEK